MPQSSSFLFLHISKTAGTSFRYGAAQALGKERCHFDYGKASADTSPLVLRHAYQQPDLFRLKHELERADCRLFGGHFGYPKYAPLFRADRVLAFCRDPRQQLMSHYFHFVRHNGFSGGLDEFLGGRYGAGIQKRVFGGFPLAGFGFVGVTERYEESLRVLNEAYGLEIEPVTHNVNPEKNGDRSYPVPDGMEQVYEEAVAQDAGIYRQANTLLDARLAALDGGYDYVHGAMATVRESIVDGFAFRAGSDEPIVVELLVNGRNTASQPAVRYRAKMRSANAPRNGYVGFDIRLGKPLRPGDRVQVRVASTGQVLGKRAMKAPQGRGPR